MQTRNCIQIFGYLSTLIANSMLKQRSLKATLSIPCHAAVVQKIPRLSQVKVQTKKQKSNYLKSRKGPPKTTFKKRKRTARYAESHRILVIESMPRAADIT
jgi:hypothetical protein